MNKDKMKYCFAVAIVVIATAFCGCEGSKDDIIALDEVSIDEESLLKESIANKDLEQADASKEETVSKDEICVYVCGAVDSPGVYRLSGDVRMTDAIDAAGGMNEDAGAQYLNLASRVSDGAKIYVPTTEEVEEAFAEGGGGAYSVVTVTADGITSLTDGESGQSPDSGSSDQSGLININTAGKEELMTLPGIGESKAEKIIAYRDENGGFSQTEDLMLISGIKEGLFNKVKDYICVK